MHESGVGPLFARHPARISGIRRSSGCLFLFLGRPLEPNVLVWLASALLLSPEVWTFFLTVPAMPSDSLAFAHLPDADVKTRRGRLALSQRSRLVMLAARGRPEVANTCDRHRCHRYRLSQFVTAAPAKYAAHDHLINQLSVDC